MTAGFSMAELDDAKAAMAAVPTTGGGRPSSYKTADGKRVPGVTTILGKFKDAGGLIHWAWECGRDGKDYREMRDAAASAGSIAHGWIDGGIHQRVMADPPPDIAPDIVAKALVGYAAFRSWRDSMRLVVTDTETALVSEMYRFGGTYDAIGTVG